MSLNIHYTNETEYYVAFSHIPGIGPMTVQKLITHFGSIQAAYETPIESLVKLIPAKIAQEFANFRTEKSPYSILKSLLKKDIQVLTPDLPQYPLKLRNIAAFPLCLYVKGNISIIVEQSQTSSQKRSLAIAIVGSRDCTNYGRYLTNLFTARLASAGVVIISGMAAGIDALAHTITLKYKSHTVAVLGSGIDIIYPRSNKDLYQRILTEGSTIISEFPPGYKTIPAHFVTRNRLISALSDGVLIIEGTKTSGTLKTADHAGDQGKPIFLPPYNLNAEYGYTFSHLMQNGGHFVFSPDDIFEHLNVKPPALPPEMILNLTESEAELMSLIRQDIADPDKLSEKLMTPINLILNRLSELEIQGHIAKNSLGEYYVC